VECANFSVKFIFTEAVGPFEHACRFESAAEDGAIQTLSFVSPIQDFLKACQSATLLEFGI